MKKVIIKLASPKTATTNDEIVRRIADAGGGDPLYFRGQVMMYPPAQKKVMRDALALVAKAVEPYTVPWIDGRVIIDEAKIPELEAVIRDAVRRAQAKFDEVRDTYPVWIKEVKKGVGSFADTVQLPEPGDIGLELKEIAFADPAESKVPPPDTAGVDQSLRDRVTEAEREARTVASWQKAIEGVLKKIEGFNGRGDPVKALTLNTTLKDMAAAGILDKGAAEAVNRIVEQLLAIGSAPPSLAAKAQKSDLTAAATKLLAGQAARLFPIPDPQTAVADQMKQVEKALGEMPKKGGKDKQDAGAKQGAETIILG